MSFSSSNSNRSERAKLYRKVSALRSAMDAVRSGSTEDFAKWGAFKSFARTYNVFAMEFAKLTGDSNLNTYNVSKMNSAADTVWPAQKEIFDMVYADVLILETLLGEADEDNASIGNLQDFLGANLRKVIYSTPSNEKDIQQAIESLLVGKGFQRGLHYDREAGKVKYSGREYIPDFIFYNPKFVLEVKFIRNATDRTKCVEEIGADIPAYKSSYDNIVFCVYDIGGIRDITEFVQDIQSDPTVRVCVVKH